MAQYQDQAKLSAWARMVRELFKSPGITLNGLQSSLAEIEEPV